MDVGQRLLQIYIPNVSPGANSIADLTVRSFGSYTISHPEANFEECEIAIFASFSDIDDDIYTVLKFRMKKALEQGVIFCFLLSRGNFSHTSVASRVAHDFLGARLEQLPQDAPIIPVAGHGSLREFLECFGRAFFRFLGISCSDARVLAKVSIGQEEHPCGLYVQKDSGMVYFLPVIDFRRNHAFYEVLRNLIPALKEHSKLYAHSLVKYLTLHNERKLYGRLDALKEEEKTIQQKIRYYEELKSILVLKGPALVEKVKKWLEKVLRLQIESMEEYKEDMIIIDEKGETQALIEVKGRNENLQFRDISQLVNHRDRYFESQGKKPSDDVPTILIINTFAEKFDENSKDQRIHSDQVKRAVNNRVLIVRTLDLIRLQDQLEQGKVDRETIISDLFSKAGWLRATWDSYEIIEQ